MKNVILIVINMLTAVLTFAILMTLDARSAREQELTGNLSSVTEEAVENLMQRNNYEIADYQCFIADLMENLAVTLDTESDILVKIMKADIEKGILSLEVIEKYQHINGRYGTVSCQKTVIFNQLEKTEDVWYKVKFYLSKDDFINKKDYYKAYSVMAGDMIIQPKSPVKDDYIFKGWFDENGNRADFSREVSQDICYYAQWQQ